METKEGPFKRSKREQRKKITSIIYLKTIYRIYYLLGII